MVSSRLLDVPSASEYSGLSQRLLRRLIFERRIAYVKVGSRVFLERAAIDAYIDGCRVEPTPPYELPTKAKRPAATGRSNASPNRATRRKT
jgi:excisionase family DNA binding protein